MRITSKGQVTIPKHVREKLGLLPHAEVEFVIRGRNVSLRRKTKGDGKRGMELLSRMRGKATVKMTTREIMALTRSG